MKVGLRLRTLEDGTLLVARIDPETHDQLEPFRLPLPHEVPYIAQHLPSATPAPPDKVREPPAVELRIHVTTDQPTSRGARRRRKKKQAQEERVRKQVQEERVRKKRVRKKRVLTADVVAFIQGVLSRDVW